MAEIEQVLKKYDIGGFISLVSQTHGEFKSFVDTPSWSLVRFLKEGKGIHIKLYMKSRLAEVNATGHLIASIMDTCAIGFSGAEKILTAIKGHAVVEHEPVSGRITNDDRGDA